MKKCTEISELLSAYSDNELTGSEKQSVEEHLATCESCSALLEIYREISKSADESNVPVPDALRIGVMNRISNESIYEEAATTAIETETKKKKWWQHQVILTRLAPVAACLMVVLLVWQFGGNMLRMNDYGQPAEQAASPFASTADTAPAAAPEPGMVWSDEDGEAEETMDTLMPTTATGLHPPAPEMAPGPALPPGSRRDFDTIEDDQSDESILEFIRSAYAEIMIIGELPPFLDSYEPLPIDIWLEWDLIFEIPSSEVDHLLGAICVNTNVTTTHWDHNQNSTYAIVFFSYGS